MAWALPVLKKHFSVFKVFGKIIFSVYLKYNVSYVIGKNVISFYQKYCFSFRTGNESRSSQRYILKYDIFCKDDVSVSCKCEIAFMLKNERPNYTLKDEFA